ncbi:platelet glycoprotein 4 isoform X2 [Hemitrygon akajei]|uniref:platelet glycoprotein 4 isoform X2 n=1 Tax=Hemitrygon akajei TaxID=2704970 RepID=UPI003BF99B92
MGCHKIVLLSIGIAVGALLLIIGGILIPVGNEIVHKTINKEGVIEEGTLAYENWIQTGSPVYRQFWLFHVKNPSEIINSGAKPMVEQRGPYTYRVRYLPKSNVTMNDNYTASYLQPYSAIFEPTMSVGSPTDRLTALNLIAAGAPSLVPPLFHGIINNVLKKANASLFQNRTVEELLWGYEDPILKQMNVRDSITGIFYPYNGTADGYYNVFTGKDHIHKVGVIDRWRNEKSIYAEYEQKISLKEIPVHRFVIPPKALASFVGNPDNHCYCKDMTISKNCTFSGILGISSCKEGKPIYISLPHFLYASDELVNSIGGMRPNKEEHETLLDVEPVTGFSLRIAKRIQINLMFKPSKKIKILQNIKEPTYFPLLWLNETATVDDETAKTFRVSLIMPMRALGIAQITLICIGSLLFVSFAIALCVTWRTK